MGTARRRRPRRRVRRRWLAALVLVMAAVAAAGGAVWAVMAWLDRSVTVPFAAACTASTDAGPTQLSPAQADNAAAIAAIAVRRGLPARAATIALATALQESGLINLDHGDLDSLGLFQQRPSQGWGTPAQVMDPVYAANTFYDHLVTVPDYTAIPVTQAAQAVQRSAFPDAYAAHETRARAFASALTGWSPAALSCTLPAAATASSPEAVVARVRRDLGDLSSSSTPAVGAQKATVTLDASALAPDDPTRGAWAAAQWSVAVASPLALDEVRVADEVWTRGGGTWTSTPADQAPVAAGQVVLTLAS